MSWNKVYKDGISIDAEVRIQGNNDSYNLNVFKFTGSIQIISQYAEIISVVSASNMTSVYADIWDGTNSVDLTVNTADFSGLVAGSMFAKLDASSEEYTLAVADEVRMSEIDRNKIGRPFIITAKNGVDNYLRFNFTTNTILDFVMHVYFTYRKINGGSLGPA